MSKKYTAVVRSPKDIYGLDLVSEFKIKGKPTWVNTMHQLVGKTIELEIDLFDKYYNRELNLQFEPEWLSNIQEVIDWSKVLVDTRVEVRDREGDNWIRRHFNEFKNGIFWCFESGSTSWTTNSSTAWKYCRLPKEEVK